MQAHTYVSVLQKCAQPTLVCIHGLLQHVRAQARLLAAAQATLSLLRMHRLATVFLPAQLVKPFCQSSRQTLQAQNI